MLRQLKSLESRLGRSAPIVRWGPRRIDLDLLMHGDTSIDDAELTLPHPGIAERAFVLVPLADVARAVVVPGRGRVGVLLAGVDAASLERIEP